MDIEKLFRFFLCYQCQTQTSHQLEKQSINKKNINITNNQVVSEGNTQPSRTKK